MIQRQAVQSSNVASVGHDGDVLEVEFKSGAVYWYRPISAERAAKILTSTSVGREISQLRNDRSLTCQLTWKP